MVKSQTQGLDSHLGFALDLCVASDKSLALSDPPFSHL